MGALGKRMKAVREQIERGKSYAIDDALDQAPRIDAVGAVALLHPADDLPLKDDDEGN